MILIGMFGRPGITGPGPGPGGTYSYWNPADKPGAVTLSDSNKVATGTSTTVAPFRGITTRARGKYYVEFVVTNYVESIGMGFANPVQSMGAYLGASQLAFALFGNYGGTQLRIYSNGATFVSYTLATGLATGDVIGLHFNYDFGTVWFSHNGTLLAAGNPAAGTGAQLTMPANIGLALAGNTYGASASGGALRLRSDPAEHSYSPASGFTAGFPDIDDVQMWEPAQSTPGTFFPADNTYRILNGSYGTYANSRARKACAGKCYFSARIDWGGSGAVAGFGLVDATRDTRVPSSYPGQNTRGFDAEVPNGAVYFNGSSLGTLPGGPISVDPVSLEFSVIELTREVWVRRSGQAWMGGGDPALGTTPTLTLAGSGAIFPTAWISAPGGPAYSVTLDVDAASTTGAVPSGFTAANWAP